MRDSADSSSSGGGGLGDECKCAARQAVLPVLVKGQHLHRDVARCGILLQVVEHRPPEHVGQKNIERYGCGMKLPGQRKRFRAAQGHENLESFVAR